MSETRKTLPTPTSDDDAAQFVASADLSEYDLSAMKPVRFELRRKEKQLNLRVNEDLLNAFRTVAEGQGVPYQRLIRDLMEKAVNDARA